MRNKRRSHRIAVADTIKHLGSQIALGAAAKSTPSDHAALRMVHDLGGALCTVVGIEGSYSRRLGAQLAVAVDGTFAGDLADNCLNAELCNQAEAARARRKAHVIRFGTGSPIFDFRLPCGSAIDVLVDPFPDRARINEAIKALDERRPHTLRLKHDRLECSTEKSYLPPPRMVLFGNSPECEVLHHLGSVYGADTVTLRPQGLSMELPADLVDRWTAVFCLSHNHEWERVVLPWALGTESFLIGAIGGAKTRRARQDMLVEAGFASDAIARVEGPIGSFESTRTPKALAFSVMSQFVASYEALLDK